MSESRWNAKRNEAHRLKRSTANAKAAAGSLRRGIQFMNVDDLINAVTQHVYKVFYEPRHNEFFRDQQAIRRAVAHYGYECNQRGWNPDPEFIWTEILRILRSAEVRKAEIRYLPVYLDRAVTMAVGIRAEEIKAASRETKTIVARVVSSLKPVEVIRERTAVEVLAELYKSLNKPRCKKCGTQRELL